MITSIGIIELNSIARGIETGDTMLKAGEVTLVFAKPVCPGKYIILVQGDVGAIETAVAAGLEIGGNNIVNSLIIPRIHPSLIPAINATTSVEGVSAVGIVEYFDLTSAVLGADSAAKRGNINLIELRLGMGIGGKSYFTLCGEISDVKSAVEAALENSLENGCVVNSCVIPSPTPSLFEELL